MKLLEAFKNKWTCRHEKDAPQKKGTINDVAQRKICPEPSISEPSELLGLLTPREKELFSLLLEGYTLKESAKQLSIKYSTANTHMTGIYKKLNVNSRAELIIRFRDVEARPD